MTRLAPATSPAASVLATSTESASLLEQLSQRPDSDSEAESMIESLRALKRGKNKMMTRRMARTERPATPMPTTMPAPTSTPKPVSRTTALLMRVAEERRLLELATTAARLEVTQPTEDTTDNNES